MFTATRSANRSIPRSIPHSAPTVQFRGIRTSATKSLTVYIRGTYFSDRIWAATDMLKFHSKHRDALVKQIRRRDDGRVLTQDITWKRTAHVIDILDKYTDKPCIPLEISLNLLDADPLVKWTNSRRVARVSGYRIRYMNYDISCGKTTLLKILGEYGYEFVAWAPDEKPERE